MKIQCIFCDTQMERNEIPKKEIYECFCPNCSNYKITREDFDELPDVLKSQYKDKKHLISGYLFEINDIGLSHEIITSDNVEFLLHNAKVPNNIMGKLDKILCYLYRKTQYIYEELIINLEKLSIGYAQNKSELKNMVLALKNLNLIDIPQLGGGNEIAIILTLQGLERAELIQQKVVNSTQVFVALWFDDGIKNVFHNYIAEAIKETGYDLLIIDMVEHNEDICDKIIAEIRESRFLIADFTGNRGGVYFEAGFAYGLGMPVIWTCRKDWFEKIHFDVEHYNFILWEDGEELKEKLINRIMATIPKA